MRMQRVAPLEARTCNGRPPTPHAHRSPPVSRACPLAWTFGAAKQRKHRPSAAAQQQQHALDTDLDLAGCVHFVNLTNGLEALPMLTELQLPCHFVRIQSTACEQQNLELLLTELDANLLLRLALGHRCLVYDCGSRSQQGVPRALWYGVEFTRYVLSQLWLKRPCPAHLRGKNVARMFDDRIRALRQSTTKRIKYYAKYAPPGMEALRLHGVYRSTEHDTDTQFYVQLAGRAGVALPAPPPPDGLPGAVGAPLNSSLRSGFAADLDGATAVAHSAHGAPLLLGEGCGGGGLEVLQQRGWEVLWRGLSPREWDALQGHKAAAAAATPAPGR